MQLLLRGGVFEPCQLRLSAGCQGRMKEEEPSTGLSWFGNYLTASIFSELAFSLRELGPLLGARSPCRPLYLFFAGFPGLQGPAGPPGAPGLSLPSVIAGQPGDPGHPGLDGERGNNRKPQRVLAITFCLEFGEVLYTVQPHPCYWTCIGLFSLTYPSPTTSRDVGDWKRLHFARRVWEVLRTRTPQVVRGHCLPWGWALLPISPKPFSSGHFLLTCPQPSSDLISRRPRPPRAPGSPWTILGSRWPWRPWLPWNSWP